MGLSAAVTETHRCVRGRAAREFVRYLRARFDLHVWASALFDEAVEFGYEGGTELRPPLAQRAPAAHCEVCSDVGGRGLAD